MFQPVASSPFASRYSSHKKLRLCFTQNAFQDYKASIIQSILKYLVFCKIFIDWWSECNILPSWLHLLLPGVYISSLSADPSQILSSCAEIFKSGFNVGFIELLHSNVISCQASTTSSSSSSCSSLQLSPAHTWVPLNQIPYFWLYY